MTAPSLKNQIKGRMMTRIGGPPKRRKDRYSKPFQSKPKPEGYVFGRPTLYRPEYCERAIAFMSQGYSVTALAGHLRDVKGRGLRFRQSLSGLSPRHSHGTRGSCSST